MMANYTGRLRWLVRDGEKILQQEIRQESWAPCDIDREVHCWWEDVPAVSEKE